MGESQIPNKVESSGVSVLGVLGEGGWSKGKGQEPQLAEECNFLVSVKARTVTALDDVEHDLVAQLENLNLSPMLST